MKTLLLILSVIFLSGCGCVMPQIVPQFVYADENCTAEIPDFTDLVTPTNRCGTLSFYYQEPGPGWLLTADNMSMMVKLRAGYITGDILEISFSVTMIDTVKPFFVIDSSLLASWEMVDKIYNIADQALKELVFKDQILNVEADFLPQQVGGFYADGLTRKRYPEWYSMTSYGETTWHLDGAFQVDSSFLEKTLVIRVPPNQKRLFIFE